MHVVLFSNVRIFREALRLTNKFHLNFGLRSIVNCEEATLGILNQYYQGLHYFTISAY